MTLAIRQKNKRWCHVILIDNWDFSFNFIICINIIFLKEFFLTFRIEWVAWFKKNHKYIMSYTYRRHMILQVVVIASDQVSSSDCDCDQWQTVNWQPNGGLDSYRAALYLYCFVSCIVRSDSERVNRSVSAHINLARSANNPVQRCHNNMLSTTQKQISVIIITHSYAHLIVAR